MDLSEVGSSICGHWCSASSARQVVSYIGTRNDALWHLNQGSAPEGTSNTNLQLPIYNRREPINTHRTLLVGDAAGLVDPFTGEGIRFAIKSGRLAAEAFLSGHPERYAALVDRQIGRNHRLGIILTILFYNLPQLGFELAVRNPFVTRAIVAMIADRVGYGRVILTLFATLPLFLLTEIITQLAKLVGGANAMNKFREMVYSI